MITIKERTYGADPRVDTVKDIEELLALDWVKVYGERCTDEGDKVCHALNASTTSVLLICMSGWDEDTGKYATWNPIGYVTTDGDELESLPRFDDLKSNT
jgi:hypothetical protein